MKTLSYKIPLPEYVKWNRLVNSFIMISAVFFESIELVYFFALLNLMTFANTISYSLTTRIYLLIERLSRWNLCQISPTYERSYAMGLETERFEFILRVLVATLAIVLYAYWPMMTWLIAIIMGIFMMISTFFGFCLSALGFIAYRSLRGAKYGLAQ